MEYDVTGVQTCALAFLVRVVYVMNDFFFFFSSRRRHTRLVRDWSSDVCSSDLYNWGTKAEEEYHGYEQRIILA